MVDLRSDTVSTPTPEMREAMARAEVGDDVWGEDPTVIRLQEMAAEMLGMEAGLFVASGTMGNQVCLCALTQRGEEFIAEANAHIVQHEAGAYAVISGLVPKVLPGVRGVFDPAAIEDAINPDDIHKPRTSLVCLENTHNASGGCCLTVAQVQAVVEVARRNGLKLHIDGARIFNAATHLGVPARDLVVGADSVQFCLSKGLGAPVGSLVVGSREFIARARRVRKMLGGGMRQAGVLAAVGILCLEKTIHRLHEDHAHARQIAECLARHRGVTIDLETVQTNIIRFGFAREDLDTAGLAAALLERGILIDGRRPPHVRLVTHHDVSAADTQAIVQALDAILS